MLPPLRLRHAQRSAKLYFASILCRYKENEVAVGQPRRFCFDLLIPEDNEKGQQINPPLPQAS